MRWHPASGFARNGRAATWSLESVRVPAVLAGHAVEHGPDGSARRIELDVDLAGPPPAATDRAALVLVRQGGGHGGQLSRIGNRRRG